MERERRQTEAEEGVLAEIWGIRGSLPVSGPAYEKFGGNTSCISIRTGTCLLILDAGTGITVLGKKLVKEGFRGRADLFLSHVHLDHIQGLAAFPLLFCRGVELVIHGERREGMGLKEQLDRIFSPPYWPVRLEQAQATVRFREIGDRERVDLGEGLAVDTFRASHPDHCLMMKVSSGNTSLLYATDCEMDETFMEQAETFAGGSRVIVADAQYGPEELEARRGWGHSSWVQGNGFARRCGAEQVIHTHFDWNADDDCLSLREEQAKRDWSGALFAREGMRLRL